ncbi:hypothetical protein MCOR25_000008 [Pyricularia grisea]|nr:hypothetical protein MCOR25_000008 [Pyricularia grisea]
MSSSVRVSSLLAAALLAFAPPTLAKDWEGEPYKWLFQFPLPIPPLKTKKYDTFTHPTTGGPIKYYELEEKVFSQNVYPDRGNATLRGYDGMSPGPTFLVERDEEAIVRITNHATRPTSTHLHGSYSRPAFDGWAEDLTPVGSFKDYYYPNGQNGRMLWYHDHAIDHTAENAYYGLAGAYIIHDKNEDKLGLPSGYGQFDVPLVLSAKQYNKDGSLFSPEGETTSLYGDVIQVNGQPWPFMNVQARKYRFRFLNAAISRTFWMYFELTDQVGKKIPFQVIATDSGLLSGPQKTDNMYISMAERYEIVFDFKDFKGKTITLRNERNFAPDTDYLHTDKVMVFKVAKDSVSDPSQVPSTFRTIPYPPAKTTVDKHFKFERNNGQWTINGVTWEDANNRVLAKPQRGSTEVWELENSSGGWSHPIHVHLVDFQVIKRVNGKRTLQSYETAGLKDVVWLGPGETVTVRAIFGPMEGLYMFHCHNLIHEDHAMMAAFNVTHLDDLGYNDPDFMDPMEQRWQAKPEGPELYTSDAVKQRIDYMAKAGPYVDIKGIEDKLTSYWTSKASSTTPSSSSGGKSDDSGKSGSGKGSDDSGKSGSGKGSDDKKTKTKRNEGFMARRMVKPTGK